jgi:hypothetical protein
MLERSSARYNPPTGKADLRGKVLDGALKYVSLRSG